MTRGQTIWTPGPPGWGFVSPGNSIGKLGRRIADPRRWVSIQLLPAALRKGSCQNQRLRTLIILLLSDWIPQQSPSPTKTSMNGTNTMNSILCSSSFKVIMTALPIASSRVHTDNYTPAPSSRARLMSRSLPCAYDFGVKASIRIPKEKGCGQPRNTDEPNLYNILPRGYLYNFCSSNVGITRIATRNSDSTDLFDGSSG